MPEIKMAVIHDYLCSVGGSERIFQYICEEFAEADAYTLAFNPDRTLQYFRHRGVRTTWLNRLVQTTDAFRWSFPLATYVMQRLDLSRYDVVLTSSATVAKYVTVPNGVHICYCYIPTRAIWHFDEYFGGSFKSKILKCILPYLRRRDYRAAQRIQQFIAISENSRDYIREYYDRESLVIHCPIDLDNFRPVEATRKGYLIVSRLELWKKLDYAIKAFNELGLPLKIIGTGEAETELRKIAGPNISFLGAVDDETLTREYSSAEAVIFTPFLEYGLIPLEANACGTPVICFGKGGVTETMIPPEDASRPPTAVFFDQQTPESLIQAIHRFGQLEFDENYLVRHASHWGVPAFKQKLRAVVDDIILSGDSVVHNRKPRQ